MAKKTLRVLARGEAKVPDYAAHAANLTSRFIGWEFDADLGDEYVNAAGQTVKSGGHRKKADVTVLEFEPGSALFGEYVMRLRDGDLYAADEATAKLGGELAPSATARAAKKASE